MKQTIFKFLPLALGMFLGWMIVNPPLWMQGLGPFAWIVNLALAALLLLSAVPIFALASLPAELQIGPLTEPVPGELQRLREQFLALGFQDVGPPLRVEIAPAATLLGFVHPTEPVYGTAFRTGTVPAKVSHDFVSILDGDRGGLTTNTDPQGAALPAAPGGFRQVLPGQTLEALFRAHLEGIHDLREAGVGVRPVSTEAFQRDLSMALRRQRETFLSSPVRGSLLLFWRAATRQVPFVGRLREQQIAARQLQCLRGGQTQRAF